MVYLCSALCSSGSADTLCSTLSRYHRPLFSCLFLCFAVVQPPTLEPRCIKQDRACTVCRVLPPSERLPRCGVGSHEVAVRETVRSKFFPVHDSFRVVHLLSFLSVLSDTMSDMLLDEVLDRHSEVVCYLFLCVNPWSGFIPPFNSRIPDTAVFFKTGN